MSLTPSQASTLKTAIQGDTSVAAMVAAKDANGIAANYNGPSSTQVWNKATPADVIVAAILPADFLALTTGGQLAVNAMLAGGSIDATNANIQSWFTTVFSGKATTIANLTAAAKRAATKLEALFVTNSVTALDGYSPTGSDVASAMGW
ncbi:MAG: hypothetical protein KGL39_34710 [Patescibacteria group bacterium]|nr:hypothetical protein [Patescibacteria group bacterium]